MAEEEGGLFDMLEEIRLGLFRRASQVQIGDKDAAATYEKLVIADKITEELRNSIARIVDDGKVAEHARSHADRIAQIPDRKRRWI